MKSKIKSKRLLSTKLENLADKVDREIRKMNKGSVYPMYPAQMFKRLERIYYEVGKAAYMADKIEEENGWAQENDQRKLSELFK